MRRGALILFLLSVLAAGALEPAGPVVREIAIESLGKRPIDESFVRSHTRLEIDAELTQNTVFQDTRALLATKRFSKVEVMAEPIEGGVRLVYRLEAKPRLVGEVEVRGVKHFRTSRVRDWLGLRIGDLVDEQALGVGVCKILSEYRKDLYSDARADWTIDETSQNGAFVAVTLRVKEGRPARLAEVQYDGNRHIGTRRLRGIFKPRPRWHPMSWFSPPKYDSQSLENVRRQILELYQNDGFLDARVVTPQVRRNDKGGVVVEIAIEEGVGYRFGDIRVGGSGLEILPEAELEKYLQTEKDTVASAETIKATASALRDVFGSRGYVDTRVRPVYESDPATGTLGVRFEITEGELNTIRNVVIRGNTRTRDKVIRRELLVYPGEIFNEVKVRRSERIVQNLGFFETVRSDAADTRVRGQKDLVFTLEEKRTGQFMVGAGFSSIDKVMGFAELSQGNFDIRGWPYFTGGGQKLKLTGQFGSTRSEAAISFVEPWFMDRKLSLGFDIYMRDLDYTDYDVTRTGVAISLGKPLPGPNRVNLTYRIERSDIKDIADTNRYVRLDSPEVDYFFTSEEDRITSSLRLKLTHDTRDSPFLPSRGNRISLFGYLAGGALGFDTDIYGVGLTTYSYVPLWFRHVLSLRTRWEVVEEYGDMAEVPLDDRLFIGGGRTIRGYDYRDVGPKVIRADTIGNPTGYRSVGGQTLGMASAEYLVPIVKGLRLAGFFDIGNVWRDPYDFDVGNTASGAGIGIRLDMPGFPIRIDRAWAIDKDDEITQEDEWAIWIGYDN